LADQQRAPPALDAAQHHEPAVAVRSGEVLHLPPAGQRPESVALVNGMLLADPSARPSIAAVHATLMASCPEVAAARVLPMGGCLPMPGGCLFSLAPRRRRRRGLFRFNLGPLAGDERAAAW